MSAIVRFIRTTVVGGVLFFVPFVVVVVILNKAVVLARQALGPIANRLPEAVVSAPGLSTVAAIVVVAALCFVAGLAAQTLIARRFVGWLEANLLSNVPGYDYLKQAGASVLNVGEMEDHPVVLVMLGGAWRIGVQTDVLPSGLVAVFVPNSPNSFAGAVFLVEPDRVRAAGVSLASALSVLRRCGGGVGDLLADFRSRCAGRAPAPSGLTPASARASQTRAAQGALDRGRLIEAVAGIAIGRAALLGAAVRIQGQRIRMHGLHVASRRRSAWCEVSKPSALKPRTARPNSPPRRRERASRRQASSWSLRWPCPGQPSPRRVQAPPQECSESDSVHAPCVRRFVVRYVRPRLSPGGQPCGIETRQIFTGSPGRDPSTAGS